MRTISLLERSVRFIRDSYCECEECETCSDAQGGICPVPEIQHYLAEELGYDNE